MVCMKSRSPVMPVPRFSAMPEMAADQVEIGIMMQTGAAVASIR